MHGLRSIALAPAALALVAGAAAALAASSYPDPVGDVKGGAGSDIAAVSVSHTARTVTFRVRFAKAPPLGASARQRWVDMLLIGIDVPPLGEAPRAPGGEWPGVNFALGTHGPSRVGQLVELARNRSTQVTTFAIDASGRTLRFSIPRRALGNPSWFVFSLATALEGTREVEGGVDVVPDRGTYRYQLTAPG